MVILAIGAGLQVYMWVEYYRKWRVTIAPISRFIPYTAGSNTNTPAGTNVLWEDDTALYLATGRHGLLFLIPAREGYEHEDDLQVAWYRKVDQYARDHNLS